MAFFCTKRKCYVSKETNKRFRGLAKHLKIQYFPDFEPPSGLGKRVGPKGFRAGSALDRAVNCMISKTKTPEKPMWARKLAHKVLSHLGKEGITRLRAQVVVHCNKSNYATAVDVCGIDRRAGKYVLVELKYSSHRSSSVKIAYSVPGRNRRTMQRCGLPNTLQSQHAIQARATAKLFCSCYNIPRSKIRLLVVVAPYSGPLLTYPVDL